MFLRTDLYTVLGLESQGFKGSASFPLPEGDLDRGLKAGLRVECLGI